MKKLAPPQIISTNVLIIGGGGAGIRAAIEAKKHGSDVLIVSKSKVGYANNTAISGGLIAASHGIGDPHDTPEDHYRDTMSAGRFLNDPRLVEILVNGASQQINDLVHFGTQFKREKGKFRIIKVPGHTYARHVWGNKQTVKVFTLPIRHFAKTAGVKFAEGISIFTLLQHEGTAIGAIGLDTFGTPYVFSAQAIIMASGGAGRLYKVTNNAAGSTGDGYAMAFNAGIELQDMEFMQFYPTGLGKSGRLIWGYEVFIAGGATLRNSLGEDILKKYGLDDFSQMTRDMLARILMMEISEGRSIDGTLAVDMTTVPNQNRERLERYRNERRFPENTFITPSAHFIMGGIKINERCETSLDGLFAAGEVCAGVHGANRLGGNALAEAFVFGAIAGSSAAARIGDPMPDISQGQIDGEIDRLWQLLNQKGEEELPALEQALEETMWRQGGILREGQGLTSALAQIAELKQRATFAMVPDTSHLIQVIRLNNMSLLQNTLEQPHD